MSDDEYEIENDIPFPGKPRAGGRRSAYPFAQLEVGQSFFVPSKNPIFSQNKKLSVALRKARETLGYDLQWAREEGGFRIFRLPGEAKFRKYNRSHGEKAA